MKVIETLGAALIMCGVYFAIHNSTMVDKRPAYIAVVLAFIAGNFVARVLHFLQEEDKKLDSSEIMDDWIRVINKE